MDEALDQPMCSSDNQGLLHVLEEVVKGSHSRWHGEDPQDHLKDPSNIE